MTNLILGDSHLILKTLAGDSIDAVVTDPPYGLSFMNKHWDHDVPSVELWREVLRVLKPGGHVLSFGGTRTYHRMVVNIEDAGFEIRDQIQWIYGSGFPKSHNLKDKWQGLGTALKPAFEPVVLARKPLTGEALLDSLVRECQQLLFARIVRTHSALNPNVKTRPSIVQWLAGNSTLTQDDLSEVMATLRFESENNSNLNTELSWLDILAEVSQLENTFTTEMASSLTTDLRILKSLPWNNTQVNMLPSEQRGERSSVSSVTGVLCAVTLKLETTRISSAQDLATRSVAQLELRPDAEPIVLARKPLIGTVAENVQTFGTGALNIDASRIATTDNLNGGTYSGDRRPSSRHSFGSRVGSGALKNGIGKEYTQPHGRWPANVLFDESAAEFLDASLAENGINLHAPGNKNKTRIRNGKNVKFNGAIENVDASRFQLGGDPTKASRFFYVAKASKRERGEGNVHPTVKPIKLMEYLVKLVTPPNGTVFDPFMGSGTTGIAAKSLGFGFVGIERSEEYFEIAKRRI